MKHALLITAYTDFTVLKNMVCSYKEHYDCYIHVDKKTKMPIEILQELNAYENVTIISKYKVNWGSYRHISAILQLMKLAVANGPYDYYHIMSGNTLIVKPVGEFDAFFQADRDKNYMEIIDFRGTESEKDIEEWFAYYHYPFLYNKKGKHHVFWDNVEYYFIKLQKKAEFRRKVSFSYKGYVYCHLNEVFVKYVLAYVKKNPKYLSQIKYCHVGEEFFFQNIIMNSEYKDTVINNPLIYDDWSAERERPAVLDMRDYPELQNPQVLFARKIGAASQELFSHFL
ncbi:MAG: beta-1,6-N-acetylglucosaminyltransferase [Lachnospiraceae bacterium]|nr:beta-1,6-N-acetylglucosaminyltransferase [Lachnospiraceae bacterium]